MKRLYILFITAILLCTALSAQEADIRKVAERYKGINTFTATVIRIKHHAAVAEDAVTKGKFHFMQPNEAYMTFNEGKDMLIMDNGVFTMISGIYFRAIATVRISKKWPTWKLRNKGISVR